MAGLSLAITFPFALGVPGGGTLDCIETARHLRAAGARVLALPVLAYGHGRFPRPPVPPEHRGDAQERLLRASMVEVLGIPPHPLHYLLDGLAVRRTLARAMRAHSVDAVLSYWQEATYLPRFLRERDVLFCMIAAAPYKLWFGDGHLDLPPRVGPRPRATPRGMARRFLYPVVRKHVLGPARRYKARLVVGNSLRAADLVLARSRSAGAEVVDLFQVEEDRIAVAYCGVDPAFAAVPRQPRPRIERILYSGALTRDKGIFDAIDALGAAAARGRGHWTLRVAGWGDEAAVRDAARARGVERQVTLLGRLDRDGLLEQLAWADVALQPSRAESFGLAVAEAQAAGLPVVAYEAGAVPEVVVHGRTGWLTPVGDTGRLSVALETVMADAERCRTMGLAGRARTTDRFTWSESAAAMLRAIDHALAGRSQNRR